MSGKRQAMAIKEKDVAMLLFAKTHLGKANINFQMEEYISIKRPDGIPVFDVKKIWEKILLAARVIVAVKNPQDVVAVSGNEHRQRAVLKFCKYTGATPIAGRFTPGTLTNQITSAFREPRLLIVSDPVTDHQPIAEARYVSIPTIAFCNTNANLKYIDIAIPGNTEQDHSIGLMWWLLAREVLRMRGEIPRTEDWEIMVDLFFYRDPEDVERQEQEQQPQQEETYDVSWTDGMEGQPPQTQQLVPQTGPPGQQQWDEAPTPGVPVTAAPVSGGGATGETEWDEAQPIPTQQFMPTTQPAELPSTENWGDDAWNS